jgi:hypothetical protein
VLFVGNYEEYKRHVRHCCQATWIWPLDHVWHFFELETMQFSATAQKCRD